MTEQVIEEGTTSMPWFKAMAHNTKNLRKAWTSHAFFSGALIVFISITGPIAILFQAVATSHLAQPLVDSWLFAACLGSGLFAIVLSLRFGIPIVGSWAATTCALLVSGLVDHPFPVVIGAYFVSSLMLLLVGISGTFSKIMSRIPHPIIMAMLAGVLFDFGVKIFTFTRIKPWLGIAMFFAFFIGRKLKMRAPVFLALLVGIIVSFLKSDITPKKVNFQVVHPIWTNPTFTISSVFTLAIPIFLMVMTTQNATGIAVVRNGHFKPPINEIVWFGGALSILGSGFGGSGVNISAMTATIAVNETADPNPKTRYFAGFSSGVVYVFVAIFAGVITSIYGFFPPALTAILAGLALLPVIASSMTDAVSIPEYREAALVTLLVTVSGVSALGVGAPFWGLAAGLIIHRLIPRSK